MKVSSISETPYEISSKLNSLGLTQAELIDVALESIAAKNNATLLHPINAAGMFSYMAGVAALRTLLLPKDEWEIDRSNNVEATYNPELGIKILFQNVDKACSAHTPRAISGKGPGAKKLFENISGYMWAYMEEEDKARENINVWVLCVSSEGEDIRAELSLPRSIDGGQFTDFSERIFLITDNDWSPVKDTKEIEDTQDIEISITRK